MRGGVGAESGSVQPLAAQTCQSTPTCKCGGEMGGFPSEGDSSFFEQEIPVDVILCCFSLPMEDTMHKYETRDRGKERVRLKHPTVMSLPDQRM